MYSNSFSGFGPPRGQPNSKTPRFSIHDAFEEEGEDADLRVANNANNNSASANKNNADDQQQQPSTNLDNVAIMMGDSDTNSR